MASDLSFLHHEHALPQHRMRLVRRTVVSAIADQRDVAPPTHPRRFVVLAALVGALLIGGGTALAVQLDFLDRVLDQQRAIDADPWTPPDMRATGPRAVVASGSDWAFMAWAAGDRNVCLAYAAGEATSWGRSCGRLPTPADDDPKASDHLVTLFTSAGTAGSAEDGKSATVGAVLPMVNRVELQLTDGRVFTTSTIHAPATLAMDINVFILRAPMDRGQPGPAIHAIGMYSADGQLLERFVLE
jgi:hypothetical protein